MSVVSDYIAGELQGTEELALTKRRLQKVILVHDTWFRLQIIATRDLLCIIVINIWHEGMRAVRKLPPRVCLDELR